jgi:hypothetical protein
MPDIRGRRHVVLSVDQLVPVPVVGKVHEIVVGELHPRTERFHRIVPGHRLIVTVSGARGMPAFMQQIWRRLWSRRQRTQIIERQQVAVGIPDCDCCHIARVGDPPAAPDV